ncbi:MAG: hypothetical protein IKT42_01300 [Clostridia bacterium]|nr:hypothetical protein [Clostridia bacterium]
MKNEKRITKKDYIPGRPKTSFELLNKYGTYNVQPTADSDTDFPKIGQGLSKKQKRK